MLTTHTSRSFRLSRLARFATALAVLSPVVASLPAFGQIDPKQIQDQQRRSRQDQFRSMQNMAKNMPKLESASRIEDVFQIRIDEQKRLTCITPAIDVEKNAGRQYRLDLEGFDGPTYAHVSTAVSRVINRAALGKAQVQPQPQPAAQPKTMRTFSLTSLQMPNPDTLVTLNAQSFPGTFHIDRNTQANDGHWMVRLTEQRNTGAGDTGTVQLWVIHYGSDVAQPININITEPDFPTLVRLHPKEVDEHLRPLLRQFGQDQLFAPDERVAWQVLADSWPVDEEAKRQVQTYLPGLDDPDFRLRDKAVQGLTKLGRAGATALRRMDRTGLSSEQNRLLDLALSPYDQLEPREAARMGKDRSFLIDCLYSEDLPIRKAAAERLNAITSREDLKYDPEASTSDRFYAARTIRQTLFAPATRPTTQPTTQPTK